mmetsp:Transcript_4892/g.14700  ORF Transcript_4892/g.14700 Transcript_4892/m.14700 type:complete len:332 (-) Transcript_4892:221-1216(-)
MVPKLRVHRPRTSKALVVRRRAEQQTLGQHVIHHDDVCSLWEEREYQRSPTTRSHGNRGLSEHRHLLRYRQPQKICVAHIRCVAKLPGKCRADLLEVHDSPPAFFLHQQNLMRPRPRQRIHAMPSKHDVPVHRDESVFPNVESLVVESTVSASNDELFEAYEVAFSISICKLRQGLQSRAAVARQWTDKSVHELAAEAHLRDVVAPPLTTRKTDDVQARRVNPQQQHREECWERVLPNRMAQVQRISYRGIDQVHTRQPDVVSRNGPTVNPRRPSDWSRHRGAHHTCSPQLPHLLNRTLMLVEVQEHEVLVRGLRWVRSLPGPVAERELPA